jgi:vacuolar-type H+-ATPase subunit H
MSLTDAPTFGAWPARSRLTPEAVRRLNFSRAPLGRRGYLEADVERFRARVADELGRHDAEKAELRAEIDRLRNYFRDQNIEPARRRREADEDGPDLSLFAAPGPDIRDPRRHRGRGGQPAIPADPWAAAVASDPWGNGASEAEDPYPPQQDPAQQEQQDPTRTPPSVQAVNAMSQAQQAADQHIAQAEDSARQLIRTARAQYERILMEAHQRAEEAAQQAARAFDQASTLESRFGEHRELEERMAYLKTFAEISKVQMRSVLDALGGELDRLTDGLSAVNRSPAGRGTPPQPAPAQDSEPPAPGPVTQPTRTLDLRALESRSPQQ